MYIYCVEADKLKKINLETRKKIINKIHARTKNLYFINNSLKYNN